MERLNKKLIQTINNINIYFSKDYNKYQCWNKKICLEEFNTLEDAKEFANNTLDFVTNKYECTFWDYYGIEFTEYAKSFAKKQEAYNYVDKIINEHSIFKVEVYRNNKLIQKLGN